MPLVPRAGVLSTDADRDPARAGQHRETRRSSGLQWTCDSAYRFFPLVRHDDLGLTLHPFDLATSKVLALVGRVEPRDFVDTLTCDGTVQPFGYLAWAACAKDPGFSPAAILEEAARANRFVDVGVDILNPVQTSAGRMANLPPENIVAMVDAADHC